MLQFLGVPASASQVEMPAGVAVDKVVMQLSRHDKCSECSECNVGASSCSAFAMHPLVFQGRSSRSRSRSHGKKARRNVVLGWKRARFLNLIQSARLVQAKKEKEKKDKEKKEKKEKKDKDKEKEKKAKEKVKEKEKEKEKKAGESCQDAVPFQHLPKCGKL